MKISISDPHGEMAAIIDQAELESVEDVCEVFVDEVTALAQRIADQLVEAVEDGSLEAVTGLNIGITVTP